MEEYRRTDFIATESTFDKKSELPPNKVAVKIETEPSNGDIQTLSDDNSGEMSDEKDFMLTKTGPI